MAGNGKVEFSAYIDEDLYDRFTKHVPSFGGSAWFIRSALEAFCDEMDKHPEVQSTLNQSVRKMVRESHKRASL